MNAHSCFLRLLALTSALLLASCGGGGGGTGSTYPTPETPLPPASADTPMTALVVPPNMTWSTAQGRLIQLRVVDPSGQAQAGAGVTLFTVSRVSPHDGADLERPVAMDRIEQAATDQWGQLAFRAQIPAHLREVMLIATHGDLSARQVLAVEGLQAEVTLALAP